MAQSLANLNNEVNTIYVAAANSADIGPLASSISKAVPGSTVTDENTLASEVTGSISSAASLANNLGKWLAIAVLVAAFLLASLLTMSAVSRRIREFGTLKALGWKSRRVVGQVMGESIAIGVVGGALGVGLGFLGASLVEHFSAPLTATLGPNHRHRHAGRRAVIRRWRRRFPRWRRLPRRRHRRRWQSLPRRVLGREGRGHGHGAPDRAGHDRRDRGRGGARHPRRADRRIVRRLAGGAAAPGGGPDQGRLTTEPRETQVMYKLKGVTKDYPKGRDNCARAARRGPGDP